MKRLLRRLEDLGESRRSIGCLHEEFKQATGVEFFRLSSVLQESCGLTLEESVEIAKEIMDVIVKLGLKPDDKAPYRSIKLSNKEGQLAFVDQAGRSQDAKIGKVLRKLFPQVPDHELAKIISSIEAAKSSDLSIKLYDDVPHWYNSSHLQADEGSSLKKSCMNDKEYVKFYDGEDVQVLVLVDRESKLGTGRCLVWQAHLGSPEGHIKMFADRLYLDQDGDEAIFDDFCSKHGIVTPRTTRENTSSSKWFYQVKKPAKDIKYFPYLDTLRHVYVDLDTKSVWLSTESDAASE